ncbi:hypothetical protein QYS49_36150 [Marivirga salinae]|uniref:Lipocalin-like domain-containing protein n=1 Tax=Marivirga salinarum TaxID=3059078 RepID=A0AA51NC20_9BACT|nr:hypothetical protein [Marivirga sp. BDSF4-3]WMN10826.1 hypothetical protein QYS49_36150 [Marivirga sp. BDSF4-3]
MLLKKTSIPLLLFIIICSCNSKKKYYNNFLEQLAGNYEIAELNYISSQGADSTIYDAGTFYFDNCGYHKTTSESICGGSIYIQPLDTEGSLEYHVFDERTMYISVDWLSDNEKNPLIYANCEVFFDGKKTILEFKDKESAQESNFNFYPYSIVLSKY